MVGVDVVVGVEAFAAEVADGDFAGGVDGANGGIVLAGGVDFGYSGFGVGDEPS